MMSMSSKIIDLQDKYIKAREQSKEEIRRLHLKINKLSPFSHSEQADRSLLGTPKALVLFVIIVQLGSSLEAATNSYTNR